MDQVRALKTADAGDNPRFVSVLQAISEQCGPPFIICDQLEELLGSGRLPGQASFREAEKLLPVIGEVLDQVPRTRILLCLRSEYLDHLRPLNRIVVTGMSKRQYHLPPMRPQTLQDVVCLSGAKGGLGVEARATELLIRWASDATRDPALGGLPDDTGEANLLYLQSLLWDMAGVWSRGKRRSGVKLAWLTNTFAREGIREEPTGTALVFRAMSRFMDALLPEGEDAPSQYNPKNAAPPTQLVRRQAARMVGEFSSPSGFKRHISSGQLVFRAVVSELRILAGGTLSNADLMQIERWTADQDYGALKERYDRIEKDLGSASARQGGKAAQHFMRSGISFLCNKSLGDTAAWLVRAAFTALDQLSGPDANVLKRSDSGACYELVHDGLGIPLARWGAHEMTRPEHVMASVIASQGDNFAWRHLGRAPARLLIDGICWRGCNFFTCGFEKVDFVNCDLRGCVLTDCMLRDCRFTRCDLRGVVFQSMIDHRPDDHATGFRANSWENVVIEDCQGESMFFGNTAWSKVRMCESQLANVTWVGVRLRDRLLLEDCLFAFSQVRFLKCGDLPPAAEAWSRFVPRRCYFTNSLLEGIPPRREQELGRLNPGGMRGVIAVPPAECEGGRHG
jgi:hypothetical protein